MYSLGIIDSRTFFIDYRLIAVLLRIHIALFELNDK